MIFYLYPNISGEWQPFPEDWLNYGHIEIDARNSTNTDTVSTSDIILDNSQQDERMSELEHPLKGKYNKTINHYCHLQLIVN